MRTKVNKRKKYGRLRIISDPYQKQHGDYKRQFILTKCECGKEHECRLDQLERGRVKSCGCLADSIEYKLESRYGRLTVISEPYRRNDLIGRAMYVDVVCDCGVKKSIKAVSLKSGVTKSCGCLAAETTKIVHTTHGLTKHPLMKIHGGMLQRCTNKKSKHYPNYGGSKVRVCKLWRDSFKAFYDWAMENGWQEGLELDKDKFSPYKTGRMYSPKYCCFITPQENAHYKRTNKLSMDYAEKIRTLWATDNYTTKELAEKYRVTISAIYGVVNNKTWVN